MRSCDLFGDLGQGLIARPAILESIFCHRDVVSTAAPFANESRAGLQAEARRGANPARRPQGFCNRLQPAARRLTEPTMFDFLNPVTEREDKEVAADPRRFAVVQSPPFATQPFEAERPNAIELALDRSCHSGHG